MIAHIIIGSGITLLTSIFVFIVITPLFDLFPVQKSLSSEQKPAHGGKENWFWSAELLIVTGQLVIFPLAR